MALLTSWPPPYRTYFLRIPIMVSEVHTILIPRSTPVSIKYLVRPSYPACSLSFDHRAWRLSSTNPNWGLDASPSTSNRAHSAISHFLLTVHSLAVLYRPMLPEAGGANITGQSCHFRCGINETLEGQVFTTSGLRQWRLPSSQRAHDHSGR